MAVYGQMDAVCRSCGKTSRHVGCPGFKLKKTPCPNCGAVELGSGRPVLSSPLRSAAAAIAPKLANTPADGVGQNWAVSCMTCSQTPTVGTTGLCGPCCFGEAETAGGNW